MDLETYNPAETNRIAYQKAVNAAADAALTPPDVPEDEAPAPDPRPLPSGLAPVLPVTPDMLPEALRPWLLDITERIGCPLEFPAVAAIAAAGAVLGRKVGIHPKGKDDWFELANLWGLLIGRPSMMKSPAMKEALSPLRALHAAAAQVYMEAEPERKMQALLAKAREDAAKKAAKEALQSGDNTELRAGMVSEEPPAPLRRYYASDTSPESLIELCRQNPNGLLVEADELAGLLARLDTPGNESLRGIYLSGWDGKTGYTVDRIGRGLNIGAPHVCLGVLGGIQPDVHRQHLFNADNGTVDDGFTQRFQLAVWPDDSGDWKNIDRWPDSTAREQAHEVFARLDQLDPLTDLPTAESDPSHPSRPPCLRFTDDAREAFAAWMEENHAAARAAGETCPPLESMFTKYRKLAASLSLAFHLINGGTGPVDSSSLTLALHWVKMLATHARRIFDAGEAQAVTAANRIVARIKDHSLPVPFTCRDIYRPQWSGLKNRQQIESALALLEHHHWLTVTTTATGGHPLETFTPHPKILQGPAPAH